MSVEVLKQIWPEWQIEGKPLGKGSFGVVYKAVRRDHNVESYAAIKVISIPADSSEVDSLRSEGLDMNATRTYLQGIVNDFVSEIQLMESLKGVQNIVSVEDYKVVEKTNEIGWDIYIRMELLTSFNTYICDKKLTEEEIIKLGCDICTALEICAKRNIIHRDIKPENIFINDFGYFKLGDFGIARKMENMTSGLSQKGTFNYMAPEVANSSEYDARVDTYSLGIVLYRLLNGNRLPFLDTEKQLLNPNERRNAVDRRIRGEELPAPCDASPAMADLILRACAYDPDMRFSSATDMKQALMSVANGTYQMAASNLDRTTSVRRAPANYDKTTSVRKAPTASNQKSAPAVSTFGSPPKKKSKMPAVIAAVLAVVLLMGVGIFAVPKLIGDNETIKSGETSSNTPSETVDYSKFDEEQIASIISEAEALAAEDDYEGALVKVQTGLVTYPKSADLQTKADEYTEALNAQIKEKTLAEAKSLADSGDYVAAMTLIKNAQDTYGDDADYRNAYNTYNNAYITAVKTEAITTANGLAEAGDYLGAYQTIDSAIATIGKDSDLTKKSQEYENSYVSNVVAQVDMYVSERDFNSADKILIEAIKVFPKNSILKSKQTDVNNCKPQYLMKICPPYQYNTDLYTAYVNGKTFTMCGENYTNGFTFYENIYDDAWAYFNLGGKYSTLEFDVGHVDEYLMSDRTLNIYLDGNLAFTMLLDADAMVQHITIDLNGAKQMRIEIPETGNFFGADKKRAVYGLANLMVYSDIDTVNNSQSDKTATNENMEYLMKVCPPYQYNKDLYTSYVNGKTFAMCGENYTNGFTFYENIYDDAWAYFNLGGKYSTLEFDVGHVDGYLMSDRTLNIYLDEELVFTMPLDADAMVQHITVDISGAKQMRIEIPETGNFFGADRNRAIYGFANLQVA